MTTLTIEQDTFKPFFQLSKEAIKLLWGAKLSGNDWKVFSFLSLIDPFGDRWCEIPNIESICQLLEMSHASFYRAIAKLKNLGIIKAETKGFMFQNILGFAKMRGSEQNCETPRKSVKTPANLSNQSQNCENRDPEPREDKGSSVSQTPQTPQTFSYSPDCGEEKEKKDNKETGQEHYGTGENISTKNQIVENNCSVSQKINQETQVSTLDLNQDKNYGGCSINAESRKGRVQGCNTEVETNNEGNAGAIAPVVKPSLRTNQLNPVQQRNWQWLPDGAWKVRFV